MKIRFIKSILVEIEKPKLEEVWDKQFYKWDELLISNKSEDLYVRQTIGEKKVNLLTFDGDLLRDVPVNSFEVLK
jgi:hypothetical protein